MRHRHLIMGFEGLFAAKLAAWCDRSESRSSTRRQWERFGALNWFLGLIALAGAQGASALGQPTPATLIPSPHLDADHATDWIFLYKFNAANFPTTGQVSACPFGGQPQTYKESQRYLVAHRGLDVLVDGPGLVGTGSSDPLGATFASIYNSGLNFVVWNDQFYAHPPIYGCGQSCSGPWGHSKGVLAWDATGQGLVIQVTTPSWPGSGTSAQPRLDDGNSLGCVLTNDVMFAQHFFALRLNAADTLAVATALENTSVVTDVTNPQLARNGGPPAISAVIAQLGQKSPSTQYTDVMLSSGIRLISKPSALHVPPWQFVSARLGGVPLRTATWWTNPAIPTTNDHQTFVCWRSDLGPAGRVEIATSGTWGSTSLGLRGGNHSDGGNHAKIGVSIDGIHHYVIFGDLNQQGRLNGNCQSSQNGRGGMFFVLDDPQLNASVQQLLAGGTAGATTTAPSSSHRNRHARTH